MPKRYVDERIYDAITVNTSSVDVGDIDTAFDQSINGDK
jgi:hypothetical protein